MGTVAFTKTYLNPAQHLAMLKSHLQADNHFRQSSVHVHLRFLFTAKMITITTARDISMPKRIATTSLISDINLLI